jgi:signal transduction histidine kinase
MPPRLRPITLAPARLAVVPAALAAGIGAAAVMAGAPDFPADGAEIAGSLLVGWSFIASGLIAWERRPENVIGKVMVATGFAWFAHELVWTTAPLPWTLGQLLESTYMLGAGFLLVSFPDGRLYTAAERWVIAVAVLIVGPLQVAWLLLGYGDARRCACPNNLLQVVDAPALSEAIVHVQQVLAAGLAVGTITVIVRRWRGASPSRRLAIAPVLVTGAVAFAFVIPWTINDAVGEPLDEWPDLGVELGLAALPVAFLGGLLRARLARAGVADLVIELGGQIAPGDLRAALARALRDPWLTVAYWLADGDRYVDADGRTVALPAGPERAVTEVQREGRRIAALIHDPALAEEPELVASAGAAAGLALENERLQAELRARLEELQASRARIVEATQAERQRIERDLHDGTQQRLVSIAMTLGLADSRLERDPAAVKPLLDQARASLSDALVELRELSQGIHPGILTERGLPAALEDLAYGARLPLELDVGLSERLPERVEAAAYFVVSEALTNIAKHAGASAVRVRVQRTDGRAIVEVVDDGVGGADGGRGTGLHGLADRVDALGGRLHVESPPGRGTVVHAEIPCA